jgi:hypothetical protein
MNDSGWFSYVALGLAAAVVVGFFVGSAFSGAATAAPGSGPSTGTGTDYVNLTISWNPVSGLDEYFPANFTVPAHTLVIISITSYDNGTNPVPSAYSQVVGTVGGTEKILRDGTSTTVSSVSASLIAHTFTIVSSGGIQLNAAIPAAPSVSDPLTVVFGTYFNTTGSATWQCMAPCDSGAMATPGLMTGTITVV